MRTLLAALLFAGITLPASAGAPTPPRDAQDVINRMIAANPALDSFRTRVHVDVHMLNFPWLSPTLDGTSYFRRPDKYEVVFDRVPSYMKGFSKLFDDIGDAAVWGRDQNIEFLGTNGAYGRTLLVLRLTKKIHSDILDHTDAYIDPTTYELVRMEWHYTSGGTIVMTQSYRTEAGFVLVAGQHAMIDIPHVHAVGDATYSTYQTNVAVDSAVFAQQ